MIHPQGNIAQFLTSICILHFFSRLNFSFVTGMPPMEITQLARKTRNEVAMKLQCIQSDIDRYYQVLESSFATCPILQLGGIDIIDLIFVYRTIRSIYRNRYVRLSFGRPIIVICLYYLYFADS